MSMVSEMRRAGRTLRRSPGSAVIAAVALGVGIGLSTLMFSITKGAMLSGLPTEAPEQIVSILRADLQGSTLRAPTIHDYAAWAEARSLRAIGAYTNLTVNISGGADELPERLQGASLTPSTLRLLGVRPAVGRLFDDADDVEGATPVMLLSWDVWQRRFGGDPGIIGSTVRANGVPTTVAGVMPQGFGFPLAHQAWLPLRLDPARTPWVSPGVQVIGRMAPGITREGAAVELSAITRRLAEQHPETHAGQGARVRSFIDLGDRDRAMLFVMLGAVAGVLIIACVNVTNLLIGRAIVRTKEVGIRRALGASPLQVALPFLAESAVLAAAGALIGIAVAYVGNGLFVRSVEVHNPPYWIDFSIDGRVLAFLIGAAIVSAVLAAVIPALQAARLGLQDTLKDESRGASSFRLGRASRGLVVAEIALSVALLVGAGLLIRSVLRLNSFDLGVDAERVFIARVGLPQATYASAESQHRFASDLETRLSALPGVDAVSLSASIPGRYSASVPMAIEGDERTATPGSVYVRSPVVSPGYFRLFGDGVVRGRGFEVRDDALAEPVVLVNEAFERRWLDGANALGRRIRLGEEDAPWSTVIGVVPDLHENGAENPPPPAIYRVSAQAPLRFLTIAARTDTRPPLDLVGPVRDQFRALDADLPLYEIGTLRSTISGDNFRQGIFGALFGSLGLAALILAAVGLYGVMSFSVGQRRREVGVRMAIGANARDVLRLILAQGFRQVAIGLLIGVVLAIALGRLLAAALFEVSPGDLPTYTGIVILMTAVALFACGVPALRATRVDPLEALRSE